MRWRTSAGNWGYYIKKAAYKKCSCKVSCKISTLSKDPYHHLDKIDLPSRERNYLGELSTLYIPKLLYLLNEHLIICLCNFIRLRV